MRKVRSIVSSLKQDEKGLASFVVVAVLVVLLALISIGFAKIMGRSQNNALDNQLSSAANYAAQSGLNDASASVMQSIVNNDPVTNYTSTSCQPPTGTPLRGVFDAGDLSKKTDATPSDKTASYTCMLVDPKPFSLDYQQVPSDNSQVVRLLPEFHDPADPRVDSIMFGWQSSAGTGNTKLPSPADTGNFYDQKKWNDSQFLPVLRVTLYPVDAADKIMGDYTYFFYPTNQNGAVISPKGYNSDGEVIGARCGGNNPLGSFQGNKSYLCNAAVDGLQSVNAKYYYARVTPLYVNGDFGIQANYFKKPAGAGASDKKVAFLDAQAVVDVTAKDGPAVKRLQARLDTSGVAASGFGGSGSIAPGEHDIAEYGLQSATAICKRYAVNGGFTYPTATGQACIDTPHITMPPSPKVALTVDRPTINKGETASVSWSINSGVSGAAPIASCARSTSPAAGGPWDNPNVNTPPNTGSIGEQLNSTVIYTFHMVCKDILNQTSNDATVQVAVTAPPPGGSTQCNDGTDNDGDGLVDMSDPGCSSPSDNDESNPPPSSGSTQCSDGKDNDGDGKIDSADPDCHSDGNAGNPGSYIPADNNESSSSTGGGSGGGTGGSGGAINVYPTCADNSEPGCAWYNNGPGTSMQQCHDGLHDYVICVSWFATDSFSGAALVHCKANGGDYYQSLDKGIGYNGSGPNVAGPNNWWNVTFGFVTQPSGIYTVNITCYDNQNHSGSSSINTCFDGSCLAGGGGGGNNGGGGGTTGGGGPPPPVPCQGWSTGYQPNCTCQYGGTSTSGLDCPPPPSGGGGGPVCGLNLPEHLFSWNYGLMFTPYFGVRIC